MTQSSYTHPMKSKLNIRYVQMYVRSIMLGNEHVTRNLYEWVQLL